MKKAKKNERQKKKDRQKEIKWRVKKCDAMKKGENILKDVFHSCILINYSLVLVREHLAKK
jgi:hypothetical protein